MTMTTQTQKLPYGIGRYSGGWLIFILICIALAALGIYAYSQQLIQGEIVTGMRDIGTMAGAPWGMYIAFVVYFEGLSFAGIALAATIHLFNLQKMRPVARMAVLMAIIGLILASMLVLADVGKPGRAIINLFRYARPGSPFFGTLTVAMIGFLIAALIYLFLDGRRDAARLAKEDSRFRSFYSLWASGYQDTAQERERHDKATFWLSVAFLPLLIVAHTTLGFVFGLQVGRPGWFGTLQAPGFVILAGVSGIGYLIILAAILRKVLHQEEKIGMTIFRWLGNLLMVLTATYMYFMVVEWLTSIYSANTVEANLINALLSGEYAWIFWVSVACLVIPLILLVWQFITKKYGIGLLVLSGILVNLAAIGKRFLIVVPSQTHATLLPYLPGTYNPTWVEYSVIIGLMGLGALLFVLFMKIFPIMDVEEN
jgi:molybdopterin-containing oxidoreductase family membrane subunit